jgi:hypothetical protein
MQTKLKIALAAAGFTLATIPAFAVEMPTDGSKNFSTPNDAPSYFANETAPESARVANPASFTSEDVAAVPEDGPAVSGATETRRHNTASAHKSTRHASARSGSHSAGTHYAKAASSKSTRTVAAHSTAHPATPGSWSASATKSAGKSGTQAGASKTNTTKHAKSGTRQHASAVPSGVSPLILLT